MSETRVAPGRRPSGASPTLGGRSAPASDFVATTDIPGGGQLTLRRRGGEFSIQFGFDELMGNVAFVSEQALATLTQARVLREDGHVLIGGLGMGFTLRAALSAWGPSARITVAELVPGVIDGAEGIAGHARSPRRRCSSSQPAAILARRLPRCSSLGRCGWNERMVRISCRWTGAQVRARIRKAEDISAAWRFFPLHLPDHFTFICTCHSPARGPYRLPVAAACGFSRNGLTLVGPRGSGGACRPRFEPWSRGHGAALRHAGAARDDRGAHG